MNYICDCCGKEIEGNKYALPFDNYENICHIDCVEDWFDMHIEEVMNEVTIYVEEDK